MHDDKRVLIFRESADFPNRRTFAVIPIIDNGEHSTLVALGISRCSSDDQFCKERGRMIAIGRAKKLKGCLFTISGSSTSKEFSAKVRDFLTQKYGFRFTHKEKRHAREKQD